MKTRFRICRNDKSAICVQQYILTKLNIQQEMWKKIPFFASIL